MADTSENQELKELRDLMECKKIYGWDDDNPDFIKRRTLIQKKYLKEAKKSTKMTVDDEKVPDEKSDGPKFSEWATVATIKAKDFETAFMNLGKHIAEGEWKADKWSRGGVVTYNGERQCQWKRRMTKDGVHFARIIHTSKGFVIQKGKVALGDEKDEEVEVPAAIDVNDTVNNDGAGTSKNDAKKSAKKRGKEKEVAVKKEKNDEAEPPAKRERRPARK